MAKTIQKESKIVYLQIGQNYEHLAETKQFDVSEWVSEFPDATIYMLFKRPGEEAVAPVQTTLEDGILTWTISNWETGVLGVGFAEIRAIDSSTGMVKKSHVIPCSIEASVTDEDVAPDYPSWVDRMLRYGENVESIYEGLTDAITEGKADIEQVASDTLSETTDALDDKAAEVLAEIPPTYTEVLEGIAKQYDSTKYYQKYEFVWHDGKIYLRLNNSSSPVGAWNPDDWSSPTDFATSMFELRYDMDWEKKLWDAMKAALYKDYVGYYDSQSSYNAGDVVWKDNANTAPIGFYRAKVDITPSSTYFVPANWDRLLGFDEQITGLKSALEQEKHQITEKMANVRSDNLFDSSTVAPDSTFDSNGNVISGSSGIDVSDFIPVNDGDTLYCYYVTNNTVYTFNYYMVWGYDQNKNPVQNSQTTARGNSYTVPTGVTFVRIRVAHGVGETAMVTKSSTAPTEFIPYENYYIATGAFIEAAQAPLGERVTALENNIGETDISSIIAKLELLSSENLFDVSTLTANSTFDSNGNVISGSSGIDVSDFIPVSAGETLNCYYIDNNTITTFNYYKVWGYDAQKNAVPDSETSERASTYTVPNGAAFVRIRLANGLSDTAMVTKSSTAPDHYIAYSGGHYVATLDFIGAAASPLYGKTVVFDGDSICAGNDSALDGYGNGWAARIGKDNGMDWHNTGVGGGTITSGLYFSGGSARHWVSTYIDTIHANYPDLDYLILEGGTNDADILFGQTAKIGEIDETDYNRDNVADHFDDETYCGALDTLFYKAQQYYPKKKIGFIVAQKMGRAFNNDGNPDPYVANRRHFFDLAIQACKKWGVPYIDLWYDGQLNPNSTAMYNPQYNTVQTATEHGLCYFDGQHLTAYGYNVISPKIAAWMKTL